ncbi:MAG: hypothetical protein IPJ81_19290 [Chitinophagaceae bacterium]|nr:hypothetical protein [Chitinophagaceae bacterium]
MLLQLENTNQENINRLLAFAKQHHLDLSLIDDENNYLLPGKPLTPKQLTQIIESSRKSGMISMDNAHQIIRNKYNAD